MLTLPKHGDLIKRINPYDEWRTLPARDVAFVIAVTTVHAEQWRHDDDDWSTTAMTVMTSDGKLRRFSGGDLMDWCEVA